MPGINPRKMQKMMQKMGISQSEIGATKVIIETPEKNLVFENPQVSQVNMGGQETFQIAGEYEEVEKDSTPEISEEDVKTVMDQTESTEEAAKQAIEDSKGDLAEAILKLKQ